MKYAVRDIPGGEAGTDATVKQIADFVQYSLKRPHIKLLAIQILDRVNADSKQPERVARALFAWVEKNIRYILDPVAVETVQDPETTAKLKSGDCDDHTGLLAALAMSVGLPARFVVIGNTRDKFQHIYPELRINGEWIAADTTLRKPFGTAGDLPVKKIFNIEGTEVMKLALAGPGRRLGLTRKQLQGQIYRSVMADLKRLWNNGSINGKDLNQYLQMVRDGNLPGGNTLAVEPFKNAVTLFKHNVERYGMDSVKPASQGADLAGMDGFFGDLWDGVKSVVKTSMGSIASVNIPIISDVAKVGQSVLFPGQKPQTSAEIAKGVVFSPQVQYQPQVGPGAAAAGAKAGIQEILSNPYVLIGIGAVALIFILKVGK